jgi:GNAT superfamily N-acetyltransferase
MRRSIRSGAPAVSWWGARLPGSYRGRVIRHIHVSSDMRASAPRTDARDPSREVRDLGDALVLYDPRDADPFWNRMVSVRWPEDPTAFDRRLTEALALFGILARRPHVWPSAVHGRPADLVERLEANGFRDVGGGHVMVMRDPACPARSRRVGAPPGRRSRRSRGRRCPPGDVEPWPACCESFGAPSQARELATAGPQATLDDPRIALVLARVDGEPAAVAKATTFDGLTYLSSIGTRPAFRGRGLGALVTRDAVVAGVARGGRLAYLGVFSGNGTAFRLYERLGFLTIGESPDLLLE